MRFARQEHLTARELIGGTFIELRDAARPVLIFLGLMLVLDAADALIDDEIVGAGLFLGELVVFFVGEFLLFQIMLRRSDGIGRPPPLAMVRFVGLALIVLLGVGLATNSSSSPGSSSARAGSWRPACWCPSGQVYSPRWVAATRRPRAIPLRSASPRSG